LRNLCVLNDQSLELVVNSGACAVLMHCIRWHLDKGLVPTASQPLSMYISF
jgi:hypothetical protein